MKLGRIAALVMSTGLVAACGSGSGGGGVSSGRPRTGAAVPNTGTVSVLYAGSLVNLMEHDVGPAFARYSGYTYQGFGAGSTALAAQIKSNVRRGDVFVSASPKADAELEGASNGNHVRWYATFARAPLVIGYNPHSQFAAQFRQKPWYRVITSPGIRVGVTDPKLDPKGKLTVKALDQAATALHLPALATSLKGFAVFPEESLVGRLESGQLDAGFFYANEAREQHIPTVPLTPVEASATYTITVLGGAADSHGAYLFISYLLGPKGREKLKRHGLTVLRPTVVGPASAVPVNLRSLLHG